MKRITIVSMICIITFLFSCTDRIKKDNPKEKQAVEKLIDTSIVETIQTKNNEAKILRQSTFKLLSTSVFEPQNKKIVLMQDSLDKKLIVFQTKLQVNTDGTPLSYHPEDLRGKTKAINTIGNAVAVYKNGLDGNIFLKKGFYSEAMSVFERFRDSGYKIIPDGYRINWKNVLVPERIEGIERPCIFKSGKYKGYFASATALKNGLKSNKGDCNCNNEVNPLEIPALVLVGGKNNPLWKNGVRLGDLLVAYNPMNNILSYAIINDIGPRNKLGEGSVLLNMELKKTNNFPKNRKETYSLITKNDIIISILAGSRNYKVEKPFTADNIKKRITSWMNENGFNNEVELIKFLESNKEYLN